MNLKKFSNMVLSLVGALFLTLFLSHINGVNAATESREGHSIYFYSSKEQITDVNELSEIDFGNPLELIVNENDSSATAYFSDVLQYRYVLIDGFSEEEIPEWTELNVIQSEVGLSEAFYFGMTKTDSLYTNLYYEVNLFGEESLTFYNQLFEEYVEYLGEKFKINFIEESNENAPDLNNSSSIKYTSGSKEENYYSDSSLKTANSNINVYENESLNFTTLPLRVEVVDTDDDTFVESYAIGSKITLNFTVDKNAGSGLKNGLWYFSTCSEREDGSIDCTWEEKDTAGINVSYSEVKTYYIGVKFVSNLDVVNSRIYKIVLANTPTLDLTKGLTVTKADGSTLSSTKDTSGNLTYSWTNNDVTLRLNQYNLYYGNQSAGIWEVYYSVNGSSESKFCGTGTAGLYTTCDNTGGLGETGLVDDIEIRFNQSNQGINEVKFKIILSDSSSTTVNYSVFIRLDFSVPTKPSLKFENTPVLLEGKEYYTSKIVSFTPTLSDNLVEGSESLSGLKNSLLTLYKYDGTEYVATEIVDDALSNSVSYEIEFSITGQYKIVVVNNDRAGNVNSLEYEFNVDYTAPKFATSAKIVVDSQGYNMEDTNNTTYYKELSFYVSNDDFEIGQSGLKKVEYCIIPSDEVGNVSLADCVWQQATANENKYYGKIASNEAYSGYYRVAYRLVNNLSVSSENVLYNETGSTNVNRVFFMDNVSDTIKFSDDIDSLWSNTILNINFEVEGAFAPNAQNYPIVTYGSEDTFVPVVNISENKYSFEVTVNGLYKIKYKDVVNEEVVLEKEINGIDKVKPVISSITYGSNHINKDTYVTSGKIIITGYDTASGIASITANVYKEGGSKAMFTEADGGSVVCDEEVCEIDLHSSSIADIGVYEFEVKVQDKAGNVVNFRTSPVLDGDIIDGSYILEEVDGKVKFNNNLTSIDYSGSNVVSIDENGMWCIDGVSIEISAKYQFYYLSGSPTFSVLYSTSEEGQYLEAEETTIYSNDNLYLKLDSSSLSGTVEFTYSICESNKNNCVNFEKVVDNKIDIVDSGYMNNGNLNYVVIKASYLGESENVAEKQISFMLDNLSDNITLTKDKTNVSKNVNITIASDKLGGTNKKKLSYVHSINSLENIDISIFDEATTIGSSNVVEVNKNGYYYFYYLDMAGNYTVSEIWIDTIDNVAPTIHYNDEWNKIYARFTTTIAVTDDIVQSDNQNTAGSRNSNVYNFAYGWTMNPDASMTLSQLTTVSSNFDSIKTTTISKTSSSYISDGIYYLYVYVSDVVGNVYQGVDRENYVVIDNSIPSTDDISTIIQHRKGNVWTNADSSTLWFSTEINVLITATEYNYQTSQMVEIKDGSYGKVVYAIASLTESDTNYAYSSNNANKFKVYSLDNVGNGIVITKEGSYKVYIYAIDVAGNVSNQTVIYANIDKTAPTPKAGYSSVLSNNFSRKVELISNLSANITSYSYKSIITSADVINYTDNFDLSGVSYTFDGIYTDKSGNNRYISASAPNSYTIDQKIEYTEANFLTCAEAEKTYYIKLVLKDRSGNEYIEYVDIYAASSVPPIITLIKTTLGCDDNLATTVLCHMNIDTNQHEIKLIYGDEDINGNRYITSESRLNPKEILINIGISSFTTYINALVEDNIDKTYQVTATEYKLDLMKEGSSAYICFTATDSSGNVVGNINACNYDTDAEFKEYLINYLYERDKETSSNPTRHTSETVMETEEYKTADAYRIKLTVGYLNGPYISFNPFDPTNVAFDSTSPEYIQNYSITYLQKGISGIEVPGYSEPGVYFSDYDNVVNVYSSFSTIGDLSSKIGVEIKKYIYKGDGEFNDTSEFILSHWNNPNYFEMVEYTGGEISLITPDEDTIYVIRYVDNQHVDDTSTTRNIFRKIVYTSGVPIIDIGNYLPTNIIQVEKTSSNVVSIEDVVSCYIYLEDGTRDATGCTLTWNIYDGDYRLLGDNTYKIPRNVVGTYRIIFSAKDASATIVAPTIEIVIKIVDITAPVISFTKNEYQYMTVEYGSVFRDYYTGIVVNDDYDSGNLDYTVRGSVDTSKLACYILTYSAIDVSGNIGYNYRYVCVIDTQAPEINMKPGYVEDTATAGQTVVNVKSYDYERSSQTVFNLDTYIKSLITSVSDNRENLSTSDLVIEALSNVNVSVCGKYLIKVTLNDNASYTLQTGNLSNNNITTEYILINVIDTIAPEVNVTNNAGYYIANNSIVTEVNSVLHVNLFDSEQYEYGDNITVKLNGNEINSNELNNSINSNGYYNFEFIDSSNNVTTFSFIVMMASYPTIRIESNAIQFDINNSLLVDVENKKANVKVHKKDEQNGIDYELGESIVVLGYSTVSSTERWDILYSIIIDESLMSLLEIDDYEITISDLEVNNVLITKLNTANTQKVGITQSNNDDVKPDNENKNPVMGYVALAALALVAAGGIFFLVKKRKK